MSSARINVLFCLLLGVPMLLVLLQLKNYKPRDRVRVLLRRDQLPNVSTSTHQSKKKKNQHQFILFLFCFFFPTFSTPYSCKGLSLLECLSSPRFQTNEFKFVKCASEQSSPYSKGDTCATIVGRQSVLRAAWKLWAHHFFESAI